MTSLLHRFSWQFVINLALCSAGLACGGGRGMVPAAPKAALSPNISGLQDQASYDVAPAPEALVIEGFISAQVDDVSETTAEIRKKLEAIGGRIVEERGEGASKGWRSFIKLRVQPAGVHGLIEWLDESADIVSKRIEAEDVSKELFDQELALENLGMTMARLQALLDRPDLDIEAVLKIETEMTRIRAQIESIKGSQRFLKDRVAYATLEISLERRDGVDHGPQTKFMPGVRLATMRLLDPGSRTSTRVGYGLVLGSPQGRITYEVDVFEPVDGEKRAVIASFGGAAYSDHLGRGLRSWLNPYLGMRVGYGRLEGSNFVLSGEAGLEIFKNKLGVLDVNVRGTSFFGKGGPEVAVVSAAQLSIAF